MVCDDVSCHFFLLVVLSLLYHSKMKGNWRSYCERSSRSETLSPYRTVELPNWRTRCPRSPSETQPPLRTIHWLGDNQVNRASHCQNLRIRLHHSAWNLPSDDPKHTFQDELCFLSCLPLTLSSKILREKTVAIHSPPFYWGWNAFK